MNRTTRCAHWKRGRVGPCEGCLAGFTLVEAAFAAGGTVRQLDYWARTELFAPSLSNSNGSGGPARFYSLADVCTLSVMCALTRRGLSHEIAMPSAEVWAGHDPVTVELARAVKLVIDPKELKEEIQRRSAIHADLVAQRELAWNESKAEAKAAW